VRTIVGLIIKLIAFYYRLKNYILVVNGKSIVNPNDVKIETSLVWNGEIAPKGYIFYIAKLKLNGVFYSKNVSINRRNISASQESMLRWKAQRIFAEGITKRLNK
jgi:hypothetical protein